MNSASKLEQFISVMTVHQPVQQSAKYM